MRRLTLLILPLLAMLLAGCAQQHRKYVIAVSQCSMDSWREKFLDEMENMALMSDSVSLRIATAHDDDQQQKTQIDSLVEEGIDLLIVSPNQLTTISSAVDRAMSKGIPVILYDRKTDSQKYTAFIGCDNHQIGLAMGQYIAQQLGGHGRVAEIMGLKGSSPAIERHRGFLDAIKDYPEIELVTSASGDWKEESGAEAMKTILASTKDVDYVFAHNDRMAIGARKEAERQGVLRDMKFTGVDALATTGGGLELVRDSLLDATYLYPTKGNEVIDLAMRILSGQSYERENLLQTSIVTSENAELMLMEAKDAERQRNDLGVLHEQVDGYVAQYKAQKIIAIALFVILLLVIAIVVIVYRAMLEKQHLNQQVMELNQSRLVFFTNISHELRTPLTLIADPVELLLEDANIQGKSRELLLMVQRNAQSLQQQVNSILDFRKIQNGKMTLSLSRFDIVEALQMWTGDFGVAAQRKQVSLNLDTSAFTANREVVADKEKVSRIVFNLLSNALKYTPKQGQIWVTLQSLSGDMLRISVKDTGRGLSKADAKKVFERFFQVNGSVGGTGIGLALVKVFAEMHHGTVAVESEEGQGADFQVMLPRITKAEEATRATKSETTMLMEKSMEQEQKACEQAKGEPEAKPQLAPLPVTLADAPRLLIIDDNDDVRQYLRTILDDRFTLFEASDGQEGLDVAQREVPDLVVCDVMMPVMDGLTFCHKLKTTVSTSHIPVIMLTAKSLDEHRLEGYEQGADSYITKPFQSKVLLARINNLLRQRAMLREHFAGGAAQTEEAPAEKLAANEPTLSPREMSFLQQVNDIINAHLSDSDFNVEAIGQEIGLSRVQLYRKVKALTGSSVVDFLRKARLQRAKQLLISTHRSISEIAYDTGFSSPSYFAKCFKEEFGQTPGECIAGQQ